MTYEITLGAGDAHAVGVTRHGTRATVTIDGLAHQGSLRPLGDAYELTLGDRTERAWVVVDHDTIHVHAFGRGWTLQLVDPVERARRGVDSADVATAPMPGTLITVCVEAGQAVAQGEVLVVIESMKMQSEIVATRDGEVAEVHVALGESFDRGAPLVGLVPIDTEDV
ncbi:MAG: putative acyl-CoA carboxylase, Biotin/lipoyl carrier domain [Solirubrobacterales bacterium]|jgi:biotin carboxyl carrier protein|nr:putative acyl-CoA carboxylase, Biotin/lipoyl carrier domain [Solirubrobacterales bacterium]